ncbi:MAG: hypothetical protein RLZZ367_617 [Bacteroidota bacterium]|jgi:cytoskeletal protein CcmA (bactofilin family)
MKKKILLAATTLAVLLNLKLSAQNTGIGEPNPASKLSVKGNLSVGSTFSGLTAPTGGMIVEGTLGLGTALPDPNSILDMGNSGKGIVMPKLTKAQRLAIQNPQKGLMVFDADSNTLFFHNGTSWLNFPAIDQINNVITNISGANGTSLLGGILGGGVTGPTGPAGEGYGSTSTTPTLIGTGTKILTTEAGQAWQVDDRVRVSNSTNNYMEGVVTAYVGSLLTVNVTKVSGSGLLSSWRISLVGDIGPTGPTGPAGTAGAAGPTGAAGAAGAAGATGPTGAAGAAGAAGTAWLSGTVAPTGGQGVLNDFYLNTATGAYYKKTASTTWTQQGTLAGTAGATGPTGAAGSAGAAGATGPTGAAGAAGAAGATGPTGAAGAAGAAGATGPTGAAGAAGAAGTAWLSGTVAPTGGQGVLNDFYLNTATGAYFKKTASTTWTQQGTLAGTTGATGATGSAGVAGATGPTGAAGAAGTAGATGPTGAAGSVGATGPTGAAGAAGSAGVTGPTGAAGAVGAAGANGSTWLTGSAAPTGGQGAVNDFYLASSNGSYYKKTGASTWTSQGNLKGSTGATGATGAAGSAGVAGATGPTGAAGVAGAAGAAGPTGPTGAAGSAGVAGATGPAGAVGATGPTGPAGTSGWNLTGNSGTTVGTNFIGTTDSKDLVFKTNNTEKMRIQSNGLIGIGCTTVPSNKWIVASNVASPTFNSAGNGFGACFNGGGGFYVKNNTDGVEGKYESWDGKIHLGVASATYAPLVFYVEGSTEAARLDVNGYFGIGNSAPSQMLEITDGNILVSNTGTAGQLRLQEPAGSGSNYTGFKAQAQSANIVYTLPAADGSSGQVLSTNGSGTLSWSSVASGSYINNGTSAQSGANFNISGAGTIGGALTAGSASISGAATIGGSATISGAATITGNAEVGSLNVDGAFSAPIVTTSSNVTLGSSDYTVILTGSTPQVTLPSASTTTGRMYVIVNQTSGSRTISQYKNFSNNNTTTVPANSAIVVQSNGTSWYQIR